MSSNNKLKDVSLKSQKQVFDSVLSFYDYADNFIKVIENTKNPVEKNSYIVSSDGLIDRIDKSCRIISEEYNKVIKDGSSNPKSAKKISDAIADIQESITIARNNLEKL